MAGIKKVLLLNQDPEVAQYLYNFIPLLGQFEIEEAPHLISGLAKTNAFKPELLIYNLDIQKAHARDIFLAEIKKKHPDTKILIVTGSKEDKKNAAALGCHKVLMKPFDLTDLSGEIKALLPAASQEEIAEYAKLLIADDEPEITEFLEEGFSELGVQVFVARDGIDALKLFKKELCNLAILDFKMPYMSGVELVKEFSESQCPPPPKEIILMTAALGESMPDLKRNGYIITEKPINIAALEKKILEDCEKFRLLLKK